MEFRPCIDIHNGKVKQIVGGSLKDEKDFAKENFVSEMQAADYAALYREKGLRGGHIILLNAADSPRISLSRRMQTASVLIFRERRNSDHGFRTSPSLR